MRFLRVLGVSAVAVPAAFFASVASASGPTLDVSGVTAYLSGAVTDGLTGAGGAILLVAVLIMGFAMVRGMIGR